VPDVLTRRALNRATMARQLLLERHDLDPLTAIHHLVGLQAQVPRDPYLALWSRLTPFDPDVLGRHVTERRAVRIVVMRATIHLLTADDALLLRPLTQPVLSAELGRHRDFAPHLHDVDLGPVIATAAAELTAEPMSMTRLRQVLGTRFPALDAPSLAYAARCLLPLVQVPPRGVWGRTSQVTVTTADAWLGRPVAVAPSIDDVVRRYLAAFGPALVADVATWSRLTGFREIIDRMRPTLRVFHDERGRELIDVAEGVLPDPDVEAPVRFLPEYDNALLSHADRSRFTRDDMAGLVVEGPIHGTVLVDGMVSGTWSATRERDAATITVRHLPVPSRALAAIGAEADALLHLLEGAASRFDVRLVALG
jgi:hypothetical protein